MSADPAAVVFEECVRPLVGLPISEPWRGYGSALFLELGALGPPTITPGGHQLGPHGEAAIWLEWDWRFERDEGIACGSSCRGSAIDRYIESLRGLRVVGLSVDGRPPELTVSLSDGLRLRSMAMIPDDPQWAIRLPDGMYLECKSGSIVRISGDEPAQGLTDQERRIMLLAEETAARWRIHKEDPAGGACRDCARFVLLEGEFDLRDWGVCTHAESPFDGHAVNVASGCHCFTARSRKSD